MSGVQNPSLDKVKKDVNNVIEVLMSSTASSDSKKKFIILYNKILSSIKNNTLDPDDVLKILINKANDLINSPTVSAPSIMDNWSFKIEDGKLFSYKDEQKQNEQHGTEYCKQIGFTSPLCNVNIGLCKTLNNFNDNCAIIMSEKFDSTNANPLFVWKFLEKVEWPKTAKGLWVDNVEDLFKSNYKQMFESKFPGKNAPDFTNMLNTAKWLNESPAGKKLREFKIELPAVQQATKSDPFGSLSYPPSFNIPEKSNASDVFTRMFRTTVGDVSKAIAGYGGIYGASPFRFGQGVTQIPTARVGREYVIDLSQFGGDGSNYIIKQHKEATARKIKFYDDQFQKLIALLASKGKKLDASTDNLLRETLAKFKAINEKLDELFETAIKYRENSVGNVQKQYSDISFENMKKYNELLTTQGIKTEDNAIRLVIKMSDAATKNIA